MKKIYRLSALWMMCLMLLGSVSFTACLSEDDVDTNQYKGGVNLNAFGPSPVARGGVLRFLGSGLDKVTGVEIPGCDVISDIEVVTTNEIRVTVPQTAMPGFVTLKMTNGTIVTKTKLTYTEPISMDRLTPATVKPGSVLTIDGEYLNLIKEVIFADNVIVVQEDFVSQDRKQIKLTVPEEAQNGKIIISDGAEIPNWIYSENELEVVLPSVEAPLDLTGKKPGDEIVVKGKDLDLVKIVRMPNGEEVEFAYDKSEGGEETITFILPENATDGAVVMIPASGVEVAIANIGMALPEKVVATPADGLRGDDVITLTGVNMELVTTITFPGMEEAVEPASKSATEVKVAMPAAAISGDLLLNTASGTSVPVAIATLKPEFMSFANDAVSLGGDVTIQGKNLDLVVKVVYTGGAEVEVIPASATELTVEMPTMGTESGVLTLVMANGESVETGKLTINAPEFCYIPVLPGEETELKGGEIFEIGVANGDKLTGVQVNSQNVQYIINGDKLYISIPQAAGKGTKITLISSNGTIDYSLDFIPATEITTVIWTGAGDVGSWGAMSDLSWGGYDWSTVTAGTDLTIHFVEYETADYWQMRFGNGSWAALPGSGGDISLEAGAKSYTLTLTQEMIDELVNNGGLVMTGCNYIIGKITLTEHISLETAVWKGSLDMAAWSVNHEMKPNTMFVDAGLKAGMTLRLYFDVYDADSKVKLFDGHWGGLFDGAELVPDASGVIAISVDDNLATKLTTLIDWGYSFIVQGTGCTLTKVTIE
ncbi:hypothetical protein [Bacteroides intestinalis]|uniref:hypothetical protein n=1 Tax=Bacteroides intestinalis TaxID=329854 RepID=UPI000E4336D8|nr:hypothetical protein [Bacteroides intestinalis]RGJ55049.1 hypothetical protein DXD57_13030 [Bacteroides intestinalis]